MERRTYREEMEEIIAELEAGEQAVSASFQNIIRNLQTERNALRIECDTLRVEKGAWETERNMLQADLDAQKNSNAELVKLQAAQMMSN